MKTVAWISAGVSSFGASCIKCVYLDELDPDRGNMVKEIMPECGIACEVKID